MKVCAGRGLDQAAIGCRIIECEYRTYKKSSKCTETEGAKSYDAKKAWSSINYSTLTDPGYDIS